MSLSGRDGPVKVMPAPPPLLCSSLVPPTLPVRDQLIEHINLLRDMHLALHQEIAERNYRAEGEIKKFKKEVKVVPPSPSKAEVQDPLQRFYQDKVQRLPELPDKLERSHMAIISSQITAFEKKIMQTEQAFHSSTTLREEGLKALIYNDFKGDEKTHRTAIDAFRADLAQFHSEIPGKIQALHERVNAIRMIPGNNSIYS